MRGGILDLQLSAYYALGLIVRGAWSYQRVVWSLRTIYRSLSLSWNLEFLSPVRCQKSPWWKCLREGGFLRPWSAVLYRQLDYSWFYGSKGAFMVLPLIPYIHISSLIESPNPKRFNWAKGGRGGSIVYWALAWPNNIDSWIHQGVFWIFRAVLGLPSD